MLLALSPQSLVANDELTRPLLLLTDDGPPHMIARTKSGIDIDITREVFHALGLSVKVEFAPLKRSMTQVITHQADVFLPTFFQADSHNLFISNSIIAYRPTVFALSETALALNHLKDIKNLNVATFQGATGYFGAEFIDMTKQNNYREYHDMSTLPELLLARRADVVVLDYYIFYYFLNQTLQHSNDLSLQALPISSYQLIPEVNAYVGFNNKTLRDQFNQALARFLTTDKKQQIINKYLDNNN